MRKQILVIFLAVMTFGQINAQLVTDRPDQTESSSTVGIGALQIESGILIGFEENGTFSTRQILFPTTLFRYGLTKGIEIRVLNQFEDVKIGGKSTQGISDIELGAKIQILKDEDKNTEIAVLSHLLVPSGTKELTGDKFGTINKISVSHLLKENLGLGYNLGYDYFGENNGDLTFSLALGIGLSKKVEIYIETFGKMEQLEEFVVNFDTGFTYLVRENLQFDFSFGTGINNRMNYISIGCSWLISQ